MKQALQNETSSSFTYQVEVNKLSEDFSVDDELDDGSEVPWIHFEQDVVNLHSHGAAGGGDKAHVTRSSCSSKPSITPLNMAAKAGHTEIVSIFPFLFLLSFSIFWSIEYDIEQTPSILVVEKRIGES